MQKNQKIDATTQAKTGEIFQKFKKGDTNEAAKEIVALAKQLPARTGLSYQASLLENIKVVSAHVLGTNWVKDANRNLLVTAIKAEARVAIDANTKQAYETELANPRTAQIEARHQVIQPQAKVLQGQIQKLDRQIADRSESAPKEPDYEVPDNSYDGGGLQEGWERRNADKKRSHESALSAFNEREIAPLQQRRAAIEKDPILVEFRQLEQDIARIQQMRQFVATH